MIAFVDIFKFVIEFVGVSLILYLIYIVFFRYKCKYNLARIYLLSIPVVALLSVSFTFNVLPLAENNVSIMSSTQIQQIRNSFDDFVETTENTLAESQVNAIPSPLSAVSEAQTDQNISDHVGKVFDATIILGGIYLLGFIIRFIILAIQVYKILSIRKWSTREKFSDIILYRSGLIKTPFSFMCNIFVDRKIKGSKLEIIVQHELSHINNRHYLDKNAIELMCVCMWFNPIVWYIRNELGDIHEFQADKSVLKDGIDIKTYQYHLFEEIMHKSPNIANGFNHSLIKKRMIMMVNSRKIKHPILRSLFAILSLIVVFVSVSFKQIEPESKIEPMIQEQISFINSSNEITDIAATTVEDRKDIPTVNASKQEALHKIDPLKNTPLTLDIKTEELIEIESQTIDSQIIMDVIVEDIIISDVEEIPDNKSSLIKLKTDEVKDHKENSDEYVLSNDQIKGIPDYFIFGGDMPNDWNLHNKVVGIEMNQNETLVDFVTIPNYKPQWCAFSERIFLRDCSTDDMYKVRSIKGGIPLGKRLIVKGQKHQYVCFTLVFPPLRRNIKKIDFIELESETVAKKMPMYSLFADYGINIRKLQKRKAISIKLIK